MGSVTNGDPNVRVAPGTAPEVVFNSARYSDNLGPFAIVGHNFVGGNHSYHEGGKVRTASNRAWSVEADGRILKDGDDLYAREIVINVENVI